MDTSAWAKQAFREWLAEYYGDKIMPAITYAEALVFLLDRGEDGQTLNELLNKLRVQVEWTHRDHAALAAQAGASLGDWSDNARDYLIGAHAESPPRILVTENMQDFKHLPRVENVWDIVQHGP